MMGTKIKLVLKELQSIISQKKAHTRIIHLWFVAIHSLCVFVSVILLLTHTFAIN